MPYFNIVAQTTENTVVTEYEPVKTRSEAYQSEWELECEFIRLLVEQGYENKPIHNEDELISNLRLQLEALNNYHFTDGEWQRSFLNVLPTPMTALRRKPGRYKRTTSKFSAGMTVPV